MAGEDLLSDPPDGSVSDLMRAAVTLTEAVTKLSVKLAVVNPLDFFSLPHSSFTPTLDLWVVLEARWFLAKTASLEISLDTADCQHHPHAGKLPP